MLPMTEGYRLPLADVMVVALEQAVAAPLATRHLADLGARVVKIERPDGGDFARGYDNAVLGMSTYFVWLNRGKESVALDIKSDLGRTAVHRLLDGADVLVQNLGPSALQRAGYDVEELRRRNPRLVVCSISGYGTDGPYARRKAYDLLVQCEAGLLAVTGTEDQPCRVGVSIADIAAGMYAFSGILTALFDRERTGRGARIDISMLDALAEWMGNPAYLARYGAGPTRRSGAAHPTIAPYGPYQCADGSLFIAIQNEREWQRFCDRVLNQARLVRDHRFRTNMNRVANRKDLEQILTLSFKRLSRADAVSRLDAAGIAFAELRSVSQLNEHPQLAARNRWSNISSPVGTLVALKPPIEIDGIDLRMGAIPSLGEHTERVLRELGLQPTKADTRLD
jgi:itaconate CoA-transferase